MVVIHKSKLYVDHKMTIFISDTLALVTLIVILSQSYAHPICTAPTLINPKKQYWIFSYNSLDHIDFNENIQTSTYAENVCNKKSM